MNKDLLSRHSWFGNLTVENCEDVAREIERRLTGKYYTYVSDSTSLSNLHVKTHQKLTYDNSKKKALSTWVDYSDSAAGFSFGDTYGVWYHSTSEREDRTKNPPGLNSGVYIVFEGDLIRINDWDPQRKIRIVIKIEGDILVPVESENLNDLWLDHMSDLHHLATDLIDTDHIPVWMEELGKELARETARREAKKPKS